VLDVAGPMEEMDARTIAMFEQFQAVLRILAKGWKTVIAPTKPAAAAE